MRLCVFAYSATMILNTEPVWAEHKRISDSELFEVVKLRLAEQLFGTMKGQESSESGPNNTDGRSGTAERTTVAAEPCQAANDATDFEQRQAYERRELSAEWRVPLRGNLHTVEFEHGTTSGKRILWVDGKVDRIVIYCVGC